MQNQSLTLNDFGLTEDELKSIDEAEKLESGENKGWKKYKQELNLKIGLG